MSSFFATNSRIQSSAKYLTITANVKKRSATVYEEKNLCSIQASPPSMRKRMRMRMREKISKSKSKRLTNS
jgi:hypothetical protein